MHSSTQLFTHSPTKMQIILPDLLCSWGYKGFLNPHYEGAKAESNTWIRPLVVKLFDERGQKAFAKDYTGLLASMTYPHHNKEFLCVACDMMNLFFVYDEYTDITPPETAQRLAKIVVNAMRNPDEIAALGEDSIGTMTKQFWRRAMTLLPPNGCNSESCIQHFIDYTEEYLTAVTREACDRSSGSVHAVKDYLAMRRATSGAGLMVGLLEFGLDLPEEVMKHEVIQELSTGAIDMYCLLNDMHSYASELSSGQASHNVITVVMHERNLSLQEAFDWLASYAAGVVKGFKTNLNRVPSFSELEDHSLHGEGMLRDRIQRYIDGLGQAVRAEDDWAFETTRYHGQNGPQIKLTRMLTIRPQVKDNYAKQAPRVEAPERPMLLEVRS
uniref:Terpene synthase n=1 Tax=Cyclocybe aegerita TaxID=1973307 RepID=A0A872TMX7_CYCAE|nr:linalool/nerolidol synthase [Cyclocybe aegerita]